MRIPPSGIIVVVVLGMALGACGRSGFESEGGGPWGPIRPGSPTAQVSPSPTAPSPGAACPAGAPDLQLCWSFDADTLNEGALAIGVNIAQVSRVNAGEGMAAEFSANSGMNVGDAAALSGPAITIEFWMHPLELPAAGSGTRRGLMDKNGQYGLFLQDSAIVTCTFEGVTARTPLAAPIQQDAWTHLACSYDQAAVRIYRDGIEVDSTANAAVNAGNEPVHVAEDSPGGGDQFLGYLDVVRLWSRIRTPEEIALEAGRAMSQ